MDDHRLSVTRARCAKTAEWIGILFGMEAIGNPRSIALDGSLHHPRRGVMMRPLSNYFGPLSNWERVYRLLLTVPVSYPKTSCLPAARLLGCMTLY